jgi:hypothetical protein
VLSAIATFTVRERAHLVHKTGFGIGRKQAVAVLVDVRGPDTACFEVGTCVTFVEGFGEHAGGKA